MGTGLNLHQFRRKESSIMSDGVTLDGQRTARDLLIEGMTTQGIAEVPCVEFVFTDGSLANVLTDNHPSLSRPATEVSSMKFKSSAEAGLRLSDLLGD